MQVTIPIPDLQLHAVAPIQITEGQLQPEQPAKTIPWIA